MPEGRQQVYVYRDKYLFSGAGNTGNTISILFAILGTMKIMSTLTAIFLLAASAAVAADLGTPRLSENLSTRKFFDPDRLLITGGVKYEGVEGFTIEPLFGFGYTARERELKVGVDEAIHKLHAQAGGKIDLAKTLYLSAAAKIPVYTYELADSRSGFGASQGVLSRHEYDFTRLSPSTLSWTGEMGIHLGLGADLNIYYDQNLFNSYQPGLTQSEERFGTRIIFRFK